MTTAGHKRGEGGMQAQDSVGKLIDPGFPAAEGLYDPTKEKDSCGVGFIADIKGRKSHQIVSDALTILVNLEHRGAVGADPRAGDGAGILVQIPHAFLQRKATELGFKLPEPVGKGYESVRVGHDNMDGLAPGIRAEKESVATSAPTARVTGAGSVSRAPTSRSFQKSAS